MNSQEVALQVQAYLDGELSSRQARQVEALIESNPAARTVLEDLRACDALLAVAAEPRPVPASREFYWSGIRKAIEKETVVAPERRGLDILAQLRRLWMPMGAVAALALAVLITLQPGRTSAHLEASIADPAAFTYRDFANGTTFVWLTYPAENEFE
jgi:anti-sigma factor RsiW